MLRRRARRLAGVSSSPAGAGAWVPAVVGVAGVVVWWRCATVDAAVPVAAPPNCTWRGDLSFRFFFTYLNTHTHAHANGHGGSGTGTSTGTGKSARQHVRGLVRNAFLFPAVGGFGGPFLAFLLFPSKGGGLGTQHGMRLAHIPRATSQQHVGVPVCIEAHEPHGQRTWHRHHKA